MVDMDTSILRALEFAYSCCAHHNTDGISEQERQGWRWRKFSLKEIRNCVLCVCVCDVCIWKHNKLPTTWIIDTRYGNGGRHRHHSHTTISTIERTRNFLDGLRIHYIRTLFSQFRSFIFFCFFFFSIVFQQRKWINEKWMSASVVHLSHAGLVHAFMTLASNWITLQGFITRDGNKTQLIIASILVFCFYIIFNPI